MDEIRSLVTDPENLALMNGNIHTMICWPL